MSAVRRALVQPRLTAAAAAVAVVATVAASWSCAPSASAAQVALRIDQLGYAPGASMRAFALVHGRLQTRRFALRAAGGRVVLRGRAGAPVRWNARYVVYTLDLGRAGAAGSYTVEFAGRRSAAIRVAAATTLYEPLAAGAVEFLRSQRDGAQAAGGPLRRVASHLRDATAAVYARPAYRRGRLVGGLTPTGAHVDAAGGWFDAGDYLKFVETASFTDATLLFALRSWAARIPGGRAALQAEARFGTDWLLQMWDESSRVLYYQVGIGDGNGSGGGDGSILGDHDLWRLPQADEAHTVKPGAPTYYESYRPVFAANAPGAPISPNLAGRVAAAFALCAQVFAARDPAYAHRCLLAGQTLYDAADTQPRGPLLSTSPHAYYDETEWRDDMEFGASELYLATQQALGLAPTAGLPEATAAAAAPPASAAGLPHTDLGYYLTQAGRWANAYIEARASGEDSLNLYDVSTLADDDLVAILRTPLAQALQAGEGSVEVPTSVASLLKDRADQLHLGERLARSEPFGLADPATNLDTVAHALGYAVQARAYDELSASAAFAAFAQRELDWVLGANAWGTSFIVGVGTTYPHCLAAQIANLAGSLDGRGEILRGATVDGPTAPANVRGLELPEGARRCAARGAGVPFAALSGHHLAYLDDVCSSSTSEPTDDLAALTLLAAAQAAG